ncbi:MAG: hypothetical protein EAZ27_13950 [Cytophagales bacterium]|nr:MAG: hypothetical protein EAZ27_13950 [Cytophagales bacterium]
MANNYRTQVKRVTDKHRLIYKVEAQSITIITCKFHYYK